MANTAIGSITSELSYLVVNILGMGGVIIYI